MKYNKKKKLQQGGTLDIKKIMEEARRNQAAEIAARNSTIPANSIIADFNKPSSVVNIQGPTSKAVDTSVKFNADTSSFGDAFKRARSMGLADFT